MIVFADQQTSGRGQYRRSWKTQSGKNLTFSIIFKPDKAESLPLLTLACALAVCEVLQLNHELECDIKWPNDVLLSGKKVCGILTETQFSGNKLDKVIVGIGLNVNQTDFDEELKNASSLSAISGKEFSREKLLSELLHQIEQNYKLWENQKPELVKLINQKLNNCGEWVKLKVNGNQLPDKYKFLGVNEGGTLLALDVNMELMKFTHEQVRISR